MSETTIVIAGGGSAGWMSALYLERVFAKFAGRFRIILIEPSEIPTVGVGEATIPTIKHFFKQLEIPEVELMIKSDASIKSGIKFVNWLSGSNESYYHPFDSPNFSDGFTIAEHWASMALANNPLAQRFDFDTGIVSKLCEDNLILKSSSDTSYDSPVPYAYHLDAVKLASHLKHVGLQRGVESVDGVIQRVDVSAHGNISGVALDNGQFLKGDFFLDCTGFSSILMNALGNTDFQSFNEELPCDSAINLRLPKALLNREQTRCFTTATAKNAGWIWEIDLPERTGCGYVYSSKHLTEDAAAEELRCHLGLEDIDTFQSHRFNSGVKRKAWFKNCLAVGLSAGFLEPLESTGLQFIEVGLRMFTDHFSVASDDNEALSARYNEQFTKIYDEAKDFIVLHYYLSRRRDTSFWRAATDDKVVSERLRELLVLWRHKLPTEYEFADTSLFGHINYMYILAGMNALINAKNDKIRRIRVEDSEALFNELRSIQKRAHAKSLLHDDFLTRLRAPFGL
ncbi:tryptophan halogenase family protein [Alteromonas sp. A079]|uniref:tryptophan halogenase family protein n=1 Tax=Alteromonas sp. A079 TaxID=3410268 RepID=UPI003BA0AF01